MATNKQLIVAEKIADNIRNKRGKTFGQILRESGYSDSTAKRPTVVISSKGVKELYAEFGLTENLIISSLIDDIKSKPKRRVAELSLAARILQMDVQVIKNERDPVEAILEEYGIKADGKLKLADGHKSTAKKRPAQADPAPAG